MKIIFIFLQTIKSLIVEIKYNFNSNKYFKSIEFQDYLNKNVNLWKNSDEEINSKEIIAVDCTNHHPFNLVQNLIMAKYLQKIYRKKVIIIDKIKNEQRERLYKSFNFNDIIYIINFKSIFKFFKNYSKFLSIIINIKNIKQFIEINYNEIEIGKISYDDYLRHSFEGTLKNINWKLYFFLFKCISTYDEIITQTQNLKIKFYVTHEIQFNPDAILFQIFLKNNIKVFCKGVGQTKIGLRLFKNFSQRRYNRASLSKNKYLKLLTNNKKEKFIEEGFNFIQRRFFNKRNVNDIHDLTFVFNSKKKTVEKNYIENLYSWKNNLPIVLVFANNIFDGVFQKRTSIFQDNYEWLDETLKYLCKNKNINILVKKHPTEYEIPKIQDKTEVIVKKYQTHNNNINLLPDDIHPNSILNFAKCVFSEHGSAGLEYSCYGIPVIITGDATYYKNGFAIEPRNLNEYQIIIKDIHQIQSLNHKQIERAKLFAYYENNLSRVESKLNSYTNTVKLTKDDNYWNNLSNNLKGFNFNECKFYKMLKVMIKNKDYNIIDYDIK